MTDSTFGPLLASIAAAVLNGLVLLWCSRTRPTVTRTAIRTLAFAAFTVAILHAHVTPTQPPDPGAPAAYRLVQGALQIVWWLLTASTIMALVRLYYAFGNRVRQKRFTLDVLETALYLSVVVAIVTGVLNIPLKGVLATSGALAIVLGLALQSTLADLFSGIVINATAPFRVGDHVILDDGVEGTVQEISWRATHFLDRKNDLIIVPNSSISKTRLINTSISDGAHITIVTFQAIPAVRPSSVIQALQLAAESCIGIDTRLPVAALTKSSGWEFVDYEASFSILSGYSTNETLNTFYDAAHRHLDSLSLISHAHEDNAEKGQVSGRRRLIDGVGLFGLLMPAEKDALANALSIRELSPGDVLLREDEVPAHLTIVGYGVINAAVQKNGAKTDVMRFSPCEYFGESGPLAGLPSRAEFTARTHAVVFELPTTAITHLLASHVGLARLMAAKLAQREQRGEALMQMPEAIPVTRHGLADWLERAMHHFHGKRPPAIHPHRPGSSSPDSTNMPAHKR